MDCLLSFFDVSFSFSRDNVLVLCCSCFFVFFLLDISIMSHLLAGIFIVLTCSLCHDLLHLSGIICKNILKEMGVLPIFVFSVTPCEKTLVVGSSDLSIRTLNQKLCGCKRGEGGQHGLQLLLLCPQNHLPGCGRESAKGGSKSSANTFCFCFFKLLIYVVFIFWRKQCHIM